MARMITNTDSLLVISPKIHTKPAKAYEFIGHRSSKKTWGISVPCCYYCGNDPHTTDNQIKQCLRLNPREVNV